MIVTKFVRSLSGCRNEPSVKAIAKSSGLLLELVEYSTTLVKLNEDFLTTSLNVSVRKSMLISRVKFSRTGPVVSG